MKVEDSLGDAQILLGGHPEEDEVKGQGHKASCEDEEPVHYRAAGRSPGRLGAVDLRHTSNVSQKYLAYQLVKASSFLRN